MELSPLCLLLLSLRMAVQIADVVALVLTISCFSRWLERVALARLFYWPCMGILRVALAPGCGSTESHARVEVPRNSSDTMFGLCRRCFSRASVTAASCLP